MALLRLRFIGDKQSIKKIIKATNEVSFNDAIERFKEEVALLE